MARGIISAKAVKVLAKEHDRRVGKDFLSLLEAFVEGRIVAACRQHNGGKRTLDIHVATYVGIKKPAKGERDGD